MAALLAKQLGLPDAQVALIRRAAPLHDVGKIGVPDTILLKLGKLTDEEFELVKTHTIDRRAHPLGRQVSAPAAGGGDRVHPSRALGRRRATRRSPGPTFRWPAASSRWPTSSTR